MAMASSTASVRTPLPHNTNNDEKKEMKDKEVIGATVVAAPIIGRASVGVPGGERRQPYDKTPPLPQKKGASSSSQHALSRSGMGSFHYNGDTPIIPCGTPSCTRCVQLVEHYNTPTLASTSTCTPACAPVATTIVFPSSTTTPIPSVAASGGVREPVTELPVGVTQARVGTRERQVCHDNYRVCLHEYLHDD